MTEKTESSVMEQNQKQFTVTREFNAPRSLVWKAFTEAERLVHWWGPKGFQINVESLELRPGGTFHYSMKTSDGNVMWGKFVYQEITEPEKMVFIVSFSDENAGITRHPMSNTWPLEVRNILTLSEHNGKTTITIKGGPVNSTEEELNTYLEGFKSMQQGFKGTLDQLEEYLESIR